MAEPRHGFVASSALNDWTRMAALYSLHWTPIHSDRHAARPSTQEVPNGYLTEAQALAAAFRALSCGYAVERIDRPDGSAMTAVEIGVLFTRTRG